MLESGFELEGTSLFEIQVNKDVRGQFSEYFKTSWGSSLEAHQWAIVRSEQGVVRGGHLHFRHDEYFAIIEGVAWLGLYDFRRNSATAGKHALYRLDGGRPAAVVFPPGLIHAWCFPCGRGLHLQGVSEEFESFGPDDNHTCAWDDPELGIPWPKFDAVVSDRAAEAPSLSDLQKRFDDRTLVSMRRKGR